MLTDHQVELTIRLQIEQTRERTAILELKLVEYRVAEMREREAMMLRERFLQSAREEQMAAMDLETQKRREAAARLELELFDRKMAAMPASPHKSDTKGSSYRSSEIAEMRVNRMKSYLEYQSEQQHRMSRIPGSLEV